MLVIMIIVLLAACPWFWLLVFGIWWGTDDPAERHAQRMKEGIEANRARSVGTAPTTPPTPTRAASTHLERGSRH